MTGFSRFSSVRSLQHSHIFYVAQEKTDVKQNLSTSGDGEKFAERQKTMLVHNTNDR